MDTHQINVVKKRYGVPDDLASCHTAEVDGYVLEGHVPAAEVKRLLAEKLPPAASPFPECRWAPQAWSWTG